MNHLHRELEMQENLRTVILSRRYPHRRKRPAASFGNGQILCSGAIFKGTWPYMP